jgi:acyl-CoA synthetase (AMP-forming)/AMP-acid ligase II
MPLPLPHVYGNIVMNGTFMAGATLVMMERFDPAVALAEIQRQHATVFDGVPTMYAMMLADPSMPGTDLSSLRICAVGGQTMPAAKMAEWEARSGASATQDQIIEHCRPHLAAYKRPRSVRFVPDLPKTSTGKVMRRQLKTLDR